MKMADFWVVAPCRLYGAKTQKTAILVFQLTSSVHGVVFRHWGKYIIYPLLPEI
jgi:hypothetical protein